MRDDVTVGEVVEGVVVERRGRWGVAVKGVGEAFVGVLVATAFGAVQHRVAGDDDLPFADGAVVEKAHGHGIVVAVPVRMLTVGGLQAGLGAMGALGVGGGRPGGPCVQR